MGKQIKQNERMVGVTVNTMIRSGDNTGVKAWLRRTKNPDYRYEGFPILHIAALVTNVVAVEAILAAGGNPNILGLDSDKESALRLASGYHFSKDMEADSLRIVRALLRAGADPNLDCKYRDWSALIEASASRRFELVRELVKHGARVNYQDKEGDFALLRSVEGGIYITHVGPLPTNYELFELLLKSGANLSLKNKQGAEIFGAVERQKDKRLSAVLSRYAKI